MKNKTTLRIFFSLIVILAMSVSINAQIVGEEAYMKGNYVEIGIDGDGGFEGAPIDSGAVPSGMNYRSNTPYFGFVANPQMDGWANFDGDFFTPGSPENGWGFEIGIGGATSQGNNCANYLKIPGSITSWSYATSQTICEWEGDATSGTNLHFKINYQLQDNDLFYITTVTVTNNTSSTINDFFYYRNLDPDNNVTLTNDYVTQHSIISQITTGGANTRVGASQALPWSSYFEFLAVDSNWVAGYGGFANRDASDMYTGSGGIFTQAVGATNLADEAIYLAHKIPVLAPGGSESFKFCTVFDQGSVGNAIAALSSLTTSVNDANNQNFVSVFPNPFNSNTIIAIDKSVQLKNAQLQVFDVLGKLVITQAVQTHEFKFEKNDLSEAIYIYKIINNAEEIASGKLIIK